MDTGNWDPAYCPECGERCTNWETIHRKCEIERAYKAGLRRAIDTVQEEHLDAFNEGSFRSANAYARVLELLVAELEAGEGGE